ncbi:hypothetical protein JK386_11740 [Nocardioides sp. zg-536]|uniref:Uncharacterized protein n=1 Tax=Nocardioides faecalis TaxID=2803858 RepID=A0A938Y1R9_9ACTN|nr:hypothetical protein [Nocardioides faecalis]MBM9460577.1 hypothetical protein [Nocardioides faecalis]QVI57497.1 hypothetical protein KG111_10330 [Nocardioides faecalis]
MLDFSELTAEDARSYRNAYAAAGEPRRRWLAAELSAAGQPSALLDGPEELPALWDWYTRWFDSAGARELTLRTSQPADDPQRGTRPPWHAAEPSEYFSDDGLWLIDLVGIHWGLLAKAAIPEAEWVVYADKGPDPKRGVDVNYQRTMLAAPGVRHFDPASMVHGITVSHFLRNGPWDRYGGLPGLYAHVTRDLGA